MSTNVDMDMKCGQCAQSVADGVLFVPVAGSDPGDAIPWIVSSK